MQAQSVLSASHFAEEKIDVTDLLPQLQPNEPDVFSELGINPKSFNFRGATHEQSMDAAARWLKTNAGAEPLEIRVPEVGNELVVKAPPAVIAELKAAIQKSVARPVAGDSQIMVECRRFTFAPEVLAKVDGELRTKVLATAAPADGDGVMLS
ncbi:MAG TPA: hypothetical protein VL282_15340, partial [Tepidisphaeraceae bacterium]|nr:hypothetical protein [Tepidisphaeraceae bacterium]